MWTKKRLAFAIALAAVAIASTLTFTRTSTTISIARPPRPTGDVLALKTGPAPATATPTPAASPPPTPAPTPAGSASSSPTSNTRGSGNSAAGGTPNCTAVSRNATFQLGQKTYRQGDTITGITTITNDGSTCTLTNPSVSFVVMGANTTLTRRSVNATSSPTWSHGQTLTVNLSWDTEDCSNAPCNAQPPGGYSASVTWPGLSALTQSFSLISATTCSASAFELSLNATPVTASAGTTITLTAALKNISSQTCTVDDATSLTIRDPSGQAAFAAGLGAANNDQLLAPGQSVTYQYSWNQLTCGGLCARGSYQATLVDTTYSLSAGPLTLTLT